jgi:hypothetical protein
MYDLTRDPLEMTNLAHAKHSTPASQDERVRLHERLSDVMRTCGTTPDEIRWPEVADFQPETRVVATVEDETAAE